jgi:hypothetical protein
VEDCRANHVFWWFLLSGCEFGDEAMFLTRTLFAKAKTK